MFWVIGSDSGVQFGGMKRAVMCPFFIITRHLVHVLVHYQGRIGHFPVIFFQKPAYNLVYKIILEPFMEDFFCDPCLILIFINDEQNYIFKWQRILSLTKNQKFQFVGFSGIWAGLNGYWVLWNFQTRCISYILMNTTFLVLRISETIHFHLKCTTDHLEDLHVLERAQ